MKNIFFDLRGHALRVLVAEGETVSYVQSFERFTLDDAGNADRILSEISAKAGVKLAKVHCILPSEEVTVSTLVIPAMSLSDATKVIRRRLIKDTGVLAPIFHIIPLGTGGDKQSYLVESIKQESIERYVDFFRDRKISIKTISTALPSNLKALKKLDQDPSAIIALIDIGNDVIEMTMLSDHVISYGKAAILHLDVEKELQSGKTPERIQKLWVYRIVEAVYNAQSDYKKDHPNNPIQKIFICGTGGSLAGVREALTDSLNVPTNTLNVIDESMADGSHYTALLGLAQGVLDGTVVNVLSRQMTRRRLPRFATSRTTMIVAACAYGLLLIATASILEIRHHTTKTMLADSMRTSQLTGLDRSASSFYTKNSALLQGLTARQLSWVQLFGYFADNTPDGMFIEGLSLKQQAGVPMLEILFVTPTYSEVGAKNILTKIISMIDQCSRLRRTGEPTITITKQDMSKLLHFKVTCEVLSGEK